MHSRPLPRVREKRTQGCPRGPIPHRRSLNSFEGGGTRRQASCGVGVVAGVRRQYEDGLRFVGRGRRRTAVGITDEAPLQPRAHQRHRRKVKYQNPYY